MSFNKEQLEILMHNTIDDLNAHSNFIGAIVDGLQKGIMTHEIFWEIFNELHEESDTLGDAFSTDIVSIGLAYLYNYCKILAGFPADEKQDKKDDPVLQKFSTLMDKLEDDHK
jgi:hypothetical protein